MTKFTAHTVETAPEASKPLVEKSLKAFGRIPGLHAVMAESPVHLEAYQTLHRLFTQTAFDNDEQTVVWQTINVEHECHYCVPAHTMIANMMKVDPAITQALRNETPLPSEKLEALRTFTLQVVRQRGAVSDDQMEAFFAAGYTRQHVLDVVLGLAQKVMSNYVNHMAQTPIDEVVKQFAWEKAKPDAA